MSLANTSFAGKSTDSLEAPDIYGVKETSVINKKIVEVSEQVGETAKKVRAGLNEQIEFANDVVKESTETISEMIGTGSRYVNRLSDELQESILDRIGVGNDVLNFTQIGGDENCLRNIIGDSAAIQAIFGALGELIGDTSAFVTSNINGSIAAISTLLKESIMLGIGGCVISTLKSGIKVDEVFKGVLEDNIRNTAIAGDIDSLKSMMDELGPEAIRGRLLNPGREILAGYKLPGGYTPSGQAAESSKVTELLDNIKEGWSSVVVNDKYVKDTAVFEDMSDDGLMLFLDNEEFMVPVSLRDRYKNTSTIDLLESSYPNAVLT